MSNNSAAFYVIAGSTPLQVIQGASPVQANASWFVTDWYMDPVAGVDTANGLTSGTAVKTFMGGIVPKWGTTRPILPQDVRLHVLSSETVGQESIIFEMIMVGGHNFIVIGTPAPFGTAFTAGTVTAKSPGPTDADLKVAGMPAGITAGMLLVNSTRDSQATIDSISGTTAIMCQPWQTTGLLTVSAAPAITPLVPVNTWTSGDALQAFVPCTLNIKQIQPQGGDANIGFTAPCIWLQNIHVVDIASPGFSELAINPVGCGMVMVNCWVDPFVSQAPNIGASGVFYVNCYLNGSGIFQGANTETICEIIGGSINSSLSNKVFISGNVQVAGDAILHGQSGVGANVFFVGAVNFVEAHLTANVLAVTRPTSGMSILPVYGPGVGHPVLWGAGGLGMEIGNGVIHNQSGDTWSNSTTLGAGLSLGLTGGTGTSYSAGVFTGGSAVTPANIDTFGGLQDPITGNRYF
jgi:hypothetical protein